jgi:hypothetical protein
MRTFLWVLVVALTGLIACAITGTTGVVAATFTYDGPAIARVGVHAIDGSEASPAQLSDVREGSASPSAAAQGAASTHSPAFVATEAEGVLVEGAGSGTRSSNFKPDGADPNWGLTAAHLNKHLFGSGPGSLSQIDAADNPDLWRNYIQDLAGRPATATLKGGIEDVVGTFPLANASGTFQLGIRIAPGSNGSWDLVTLLTKQ